MGKKGRFWFSLGCQNYYFFKLTLYVIYDFLEDRTYKEKRIVGMLAKIQTGSAGSCIPCSMEAEIGL